MKKGLLRIAAIALASLPALASFGQTPMPPTNVTLSYNYDTHLATVRWKAPALTTDSQTIDASKITYSVRLTGKSTPAVTDFPGTTYRENLTVNDLASTSILFGQGLARYVVTATYNGQTSENAYSTFKVLGDPVAIPYSESFAGGQMHSFWSEDHNGVGRWGALATSDTYTQDKDGGMFCYTSNTADEYSLGYSGLISLGNANAPTLSFYYFYHGLDESRDSLQLRICRDGGNWEPLKDLDVSLDSTDNWRHVVVPLTDYTGSKFIQIGFYDHSTVPFGIVYVDNIRIANQVDNDLALSRPQMPINLRTDEPRSITLTVTNNGQKAASGYTVRSLINGKAAGEVAGPDLGINESAQVIVPVQADVTMASADSVLLSAVLDYEADEDASNDTIAAVKTRLSVPTFPAPQDLTANGSTLTWKAPKAPRLVSTPQTDSFESAPSFTISNFGDWLLVDNNKKHVYGIDGVDIPNGGDPQAFTVMQADTCDLNSSWNAYDGKKYLAAFSVPSETLDHWLISPLLSGEAQTISFFARAYSTSYAESYEVYASSTTPEATAFTKLGGQTTARGDNSWNEDEYDLPEGTRYFAVKATSNDKFALLLDYFTFIPDSTGRQNINLLGYNIYFDGVKQNATPVSATSFDLNSATAKEYEVSAVYDKGESALVRVAGSTTGINAVVKPTTDSNKDNAVYDLLGRRVANTSAHGVYIQNGKKFVK